MEIRMFMEKKDNIEQKKKNEEEEENLNKVVFFFSIMKEKWQWCLHPAYIERFRYSVF